MSVRKLQKICEKVKQGRRPYSGPRCTWEEAAKGRASPGSRKGQSAEMKTSVHPKVEYVAPKIPKQMLGKRDYACYHRLTVQEQNVCCFFFFFWGGGGVINFTTVK